jgi:hypothetical protein
MEPSRLPVVFNKLEKIAASGEKRKYTAERPFKISFRKRNFREELIASFSLI